MCYSCNPRCDNCFAKLLICPGCKEIISLQDDVCPKCGAEITEDMKDAARADWEHGIRLSIQKNENPVLTARKKMFDEMRARGENIYKHSEGNSH